MTDKWFWCLLSEIVGCGIEVPKYNPCFDHYQSFGNSATIRESNHGSGVCKEHYVPKSSILFARNGAVKISSVACGFSPVKNNYSDFPKSFISRINETCFFSIKYCYNIFFLWRLLWNVTTNCNQTCYCAGMVSATSTSHYKSPWKVDPLCTAEVDSKELADVRGDCTINMTTSTTVADHGSRWPCYNGVPVYSWSSFKKLATHFNRFSIYGPRRKKNCLWCFRQSETQTSLLSFRD